MGESLRFGINAMVVWLRPVNFTTPPDYISGLKSACFYWFCNICSRLATDIFTNCLIFASFGLLLNKGNYEMENQTIDKLAWMRIENKKQLCVRTKGKDKFYNPGGKRKLGETDIQALVRELKEELNIDIIPQTAKIFNTCTAQADGKPAGVMVKITACTADYNGTPTPSNEIEELAWIDSPDAYRLSAIHIEKILPDLLSKGLIK
jgi:8-oxo-dGTP pyrophosphatase MutT (NUDIX family)